MKEHARILVPVDGTESSDHVVDVAVSLAQVLEASLDILFVSYFDSDTDDFREDSWLPASVAGPTFKEVDAALERAHVRIPGTVPVVLHHETGVPVKQILSFVKEHEVDMVVLGGRGLGVVQGFLVGSVSQQVMEEATCTVVIVK